MHSGLHWALVLGAAITVGCAAVVLALQQSPVAGAATPRRPAAEVPSDPGTVLERLPRGYAQFMPEPTAGVSSPMSAVVPRPPLAEARQLLAVAARTGDGRLAARAETLLAHLPADTGQAGVLHARAWIAQHRHDFLGAIRLLDAAIARDPRDAEARLARAQVQLVRGAVDRARTDCAALALVDAGTALLCVAALSLRTGDYPVATLAVERWLQHGRSNPETRRYALVLRAEVATRSGARDADAWFRRALSLAPDDVRSLGAHARQLRHEERHREAVALLAPHGRHDGLRLQYLLALDSYDPARAAEPADALAAEYAQARAQGATPELRDEAELALLRGDSRAALALARQNFQQQRDHEDVDLFQRAARAAGRPGALAPLRAWARSQRLPLPGDPVESRE